MTSASIHLRLANVDDVSILVPMMIDFNRFEGIPWNPAAGEAPLRQLVQDDRLGFIALFSTEALDCAGYAVVTFGFDLEYGGRDAFLTELYLDPAVRGQGLGKSAMALVLAETRAHGASALHLQVRPENVAAHRLYRSAGFVPSPRIFMSKALASESN